MTVEGDVIGNLGETREFDLTERTVAADLTGNDIMSVLSVPLGPLSLYGKGGIVFWDTRATALIVPPVGPPSQLRRRDDGNDLAFGGGMQLELTPAFALRGESSTSTSKIRKQSGSRRSA